MSNKNDHFPLYVLVEDPVKLSVGHPIFCFNKW